MSYQTGQLICPCLRGRKQMEIIRPPLALLQFSVLTCRMAVRKPCGLKKPVIQNTFVVFDRAEEKELKEKY